MTSPPASIPLEPLDEPGRLRIPARLYGRDRAAGSLLAAFEQVCSGSAAVVLVPGSSGVGKSALVQGVRAPVEVRNGFFLAGKFNQHQQNIPYFALRQALTELCRELGRADEPQREQWKTALCQAVGNLGQLLKDLVPEFESLLGKQPAVADISPLEARHRFVGVFRAFLKVVCRPEHPVVLFIDDWQWADAGSLELLANLQVDTTLRYLLVIAAYRDNEVDSTHPLIVTLDELRRQTVPVEVIEVRNLVAGEVRALLADTLKPAAADLDELAALVYRRTAGNPFFVRAFIEVLYERGLLRFEPGDGCWHWSLDTIGERELPADVVELFAQRLGQLEPPSRKLLSRAACLGNRFDVDTLAIVGACSTDQCRRLLGDGLAHGLVLPVDEVLFPGEFQFLHDRVLQAAYGFIQPADLPAVHLEIGRLKLAHYSPEKLSERVFQVADHLNAGHSLILDPGERVTVVRLNMLAARKARAATAHRTALQLHRAAARLLEPPGCAERLWADHHDLALALFLEWAESEFLEGDRHEAERCVHQAVAHAAGSLEKAEALNVLIVQYTLLARYPEAIAAGREALAALGIALPAEDYEAARDSEIEQVRQGLKGRPVAELIELPVMSHPEMRTAAKILIAMGPPCYRSHQLLWSVIVPKVVNLTLRYGHIPQIGYSHPAFGGLLGWVANDYATAKEFGDLATRLMTGTFDAPSDRSVFYLMIGSSVRHWFEPLKSSSRDYASAYEIGFRSGNLQYAAYAFGHNMYCRFYQGTPLPELIQESRHSLAFSRSRVNQWAVDLLEGGMKLFDALAGSAPGAELETWEAEYLGQVETHHNIQVECIYKVLRAFSLLILGHHERALVWSDRAEQLIDTVGTQGLLPWPEHVFARLLILTALYADAAPERQTAWRPGLDRTLEQLRIWASHCPDNFGHKHALAAAEIARLDDRFLDAVRLYHQAAESAAKGGFVQWAALANERAAAFWEARGHGRLAQVHWQYAYGYYDRWGATAKLHALEAAYRVHLSFALPGGAQASAPEEALEHELRQELLANHLVQLRTQATAMAHIRLEEEARRQAGELVEATERLRMEVAQRKRAEEQLQHHREQLEETVKGRTAELEVSRNQLAEAHAATLKLMEEAVMARDRAEAGQVALEREITERKRAEEERAKIKAQMQHAQKLESLGVLAGGIAHDFNNLLTSILGYTDLALSELPPSLPAFQYLSEAVQGARRAAELIKQMLAYSGKGRFVVEPLNLSALVEDISRLLQISISKKCVLKFALTADLPAVEADAAQMRQIIMNLVINASEAIGDRSGVISIATGIMHCDRAYLAETYLDDNLPPGIYAYFEVADNGCGMTEETRARIFDPFFTTKFTGRGLGLSAVLGIVRGHRGALKCYSELGKGTTFKVLLPLTSLSARPVGAQVPREASWRSSGTVLVVDDEESVRGLAYSMLEKMGFTILLAADGREGVEIFRRHSASIRLVVLDMTMPHLDGAETFRELRRISSNVRTILSSGYNEQTVTSRFAGKGLAGFIQKPYRFEELRAIVRKVLETDNGGGG